MCDCACVKPHPPAYIYICNTRAQREDDEWREEGKILFVVAVSAAFVAPARRASARVCSLSCHAPSLQMQQPKQDDRYDALQGFLDHSDVAYHMDVDAEQVHSSLLAWYAQNRRRLQWRGDPPPYNGSTDGFAAAAARPSPAPPPATEKVSAYGVWVSEIMCQQTRVEAVIPYWLAWMEAFPTVHALAAASEDEVNAKWAGLGFYRRARMLHEAAKQVVREFGGELPTSVEELKRIKGIGPYTAGAIASIVGGIPAPIVDGNVLRVASRLCGIAANPKEGAFSGDGKLAWAIAEKLVEAGGGARPGEFNQALMELGATYCARAALASTRPTAGSPLPQRPHRPRCLPRPQARRPWVDPRSGRGEPLHRGAYVPGLCQGRRRLYRGPAHRV